MKILLENEILLLSKNLYEERENCK